jgi:hypothetical protein
MDEIQRERTIWTVTLLLLLSSPLAIMVFLRVAIEHNDEFQVPTMPLTLECAVALAAFVHLSVYVAAAPGIGIRLPMFEASIMSTGMALWMIVVILMKRKQLLGLRTALACTVAGATPYLALLIGTLLG